MSYTPRHAAEPATTEGRRGLWFGITGVIVAAVILGIALSTLGSGDPRDEAVASPTAEPTPPVPETTPTPVPSPTSTPVPTVTPLPTPTPYAGWSDPTRSGQPWSTEVAGLLTFRGNPTRTFYGSGPVPRAPEVQWSYPPGSTMCGLTTVGDETTTWCGTGWTGQPAIFERDGRTWTVFGAYDWAIHFLDADTGEQILEPFETGDIIKGSVTVDPDGYPLVYSGSRDDYLHIIAIDGDAPRELWRLWADDIPGRQWNNDWDGSPLIIDDYMFEGGENSVFHIVKLNRGYDDDGLVTIDPELIFTTPGYDDELIAAVGPNVSIENSVAISGNTVYFANSGGLVQGWDIDSMIEGDEPQQVFRYWVGDDVDASIAVDDEGFLYVGVEYEQGRTRSLEVGQLVKLDPTTPDDPLVWSVFDTRAQPAGVWATPAIHRDIVIVPTDSGRVLGIDRETGEIRWEFRLPGPLWSSPAVVDDVLIQADCAGWIHAYDVSDTTVPPPELWAVHIEQCIESTPALWDGRIIVGSRAGQVHMIADGS